MVVRKKITALIVDDEPLARTVLSTMLGHHSWISQVQEASSVAEAAKIVHRNRPDIIFLDIHMPRLSGFALVSMLTYQPQVVFVTADERSAVRAFEVEAADYLLKPVHPSRLAATLARIQKRLNSTEPLPVLTALRDGNCLMMIPTETIAAVVADGSFTRILISDQQPLYIRRGISEWEALLSPAQFLRADRSTLINLSRIERIHQPNRNLTRVHLRGVSEVISIGRVGTARIKNTIRRISPPLKS